MKARLEELYTSTIREQLQKELGLSNVMEVPRLVKIVVNTGVKEAVSDSKIINQVKDIVEKITGQAPVKTLAKKSIAGFKVREGMPLGVKVTLRKRVMYEFLDRLINIALPRVKDFQGVSLKCDGKGVYNLGIQDWIIFPEVDYDTVDKARGLNITIQTTSKKDNETLALLKSFHMPFRRS